MSRSSTRKGGVRNEYQLVAIPEELDIEVLQHSRMSQEGPTQVSGNESDGSFPFVFVEAVGDPQGYQRVSVRDRNTAD